MEFRAGVMLAAISGLLGCTTANQPVTTADAAIAKAMVAINKEWPQVKSDPKGFQAVLRDGNWYIEKLNTDPGSFGGDVFVVISQRNGKILSTEMPD